MPLDAYGDVHTYRVLQRMTYAQVESLYRQGAVTQETWARYQRDARPRTAPLARIVNVTSLEVL